MTDLKINFWERSFFLVNKAVIWRKVFLESFAVCERKLRHRPRYMQMMQVPPEKQMGFAQATVHSG